MWRCAPVAGPLCAGRRRAGCGRIRSRAAFLSCTRPRRTGRRCGRCCSRTRNGVRCRWPGRSARRSRGRCGRRCGPGWRTGPWPGCWTGPWTARIPWPARVKLPAGPCCWCRCRPRGGPCGRGGTTRSGGSRWRRRGGLRRAGMPVSVLSVLRQRRAVADQAGLNSRQRQVNLSGALEVAAGAGALLRDAGRIVVVDDLMTTGASLAEAARALGCVCGVHGVGDRAGGAGDTRARGIGGTGRTGRRTQVTAERQGGNRPSWDGRDHVGEATGKGGPASGMPCLNIIRAAVVATSATSFEINRN